MITNEQRIIAFSTGLIHEHYFIAKRVKLKGTEHLINRCITCGSCYCHICGKTLEADTPAPEMNVRLTFI